MSKVQAGLSTIICPSCAAEIELTDAITAKLNVSMAADVEKKVKAAALHGREMALAEIAQEQHDLSGRLVAAETKIKETQKRETALLRRERELDNARDEMSLEFEQKLFNERKAMRLAAENELRAEIRRGGLKANQELTILRARLDEAEASESALRQRQIAMEERERKLALEIERRVDGDRKVIAKQLAQEHDDRERLNQAKHDVEIERLREHIKTLQVAAAATNGEVSGEGLEKIVLQALQEAFRLDLFNEVPRGETGADIIQSVRDAGLTTRGRLCFEVKNCRTWSNTWIEKAKKAQKSGDCDACIIITRALPKGVAHMALRDDVWVTELSTAPALAAALRHSILRAAAVKSAVDAQDSRIAALRSHLTSTRFRLQVESVVSAVMMLQNQLNAEQRATRRAWERRRIVISTMGDSIAEIVGGLEAAFDGELPAGAILALPDETETNQNGEEDNDN